MAEIKIKSVVSWICKSSFIFLSSHRWAPSHADSYAITSRREEKASAARGREKEYIWNPHYAFSRIDETWLDRTFNKFVAYGVCRCISDGVRTKNINWWFFKWASERERKRSRVLILISYGNISTQISSLFFEGANEIAPTCCVGIFFLYGNICEGPFMRLLKSIWKLHSSIQSAFKGK